MLFIQIVNYFTTYCVFIMYLTKYFANVMYLFIIYYVLFHVAPVVILSYFLCVCFCSVNINVSVKQWLSVKSTVQIKFTHSNFQRALNELC